MAGSVPTLLTQDVIPVVSGYLLFVAVLVWYGRRLWREGRTGHAGTAAAGRARAGVGGEGQPGDGSRNRQFIRHLGSTLAGGYLVLLVILFVFYLGLGNATMGYVLRGIAQSAVLTFGVVGPIFLILSWVEDRVKRRA